MSIQVPISPDKYRKLKRAIQAGKEVVCLDRQSYLRALLIGQAQGKNSDPKKIKLMAK